VADANGNMLGNKLRQQQRHAGYHLAEIAKSKGLSVGVVTTTRITHATPAATYAHICHRDLENDIAAALFRVVQDLMPHWAARGWMLCWRRQPVFHTICECGKRTDGAT